MKEIGKVRLRAVEPGDLDAFFEFQSDSGARYMAAFSGKEPLDRPSFEERLAKILGDDAILVRTITVGDQVAGYVMKFEMRGDALVAYWIGREYWGQGIATEALKQLIGELSMRPLFARAATDNIASVRVLEKCGFVRIGVETNFASAREAQTEEVIMRLE
ncbi:MAG: GNAT family N-acetyltransferase [Anaerolineales bacterium]